jgi:hypothetical protein
LTLVVLTGVERGRLGLDVLPSGLEPDEDVILPTAFGAERFHDHGVRQ